MKPACPRCHTIHQTGDHSMTTIITRDQMRPGQMQQDDPFGGAA